MLFSPNISIAFNSVTKEYGLFNNDRERILSSFINNSKKESIKAINELSFTVYKGETVALLGRNGSGKSTVLKTMTGVTYPTSGDVIVHGRVSALLDLSAGFDRNLTGRENIYMRGLVWGLKRSEIEDLIPEVIDFAEIGTYIDQPVKTYSAGMKARLGFAFASSIKADIILVDETLAVGDSSFNAKCLDRIRETISKNEEFTVILVTHSSKLATQFCDRGIVLSKGQLAYDGFIYDAIKEYKRVLSVEPNKRGEVSNE